MTNCIQNDGHVIELPKTTTLKITDMRATLKLTDVHIIRRLCVTTTFIGVAVDKT